MHNQAHTRFEEQIEIKVFKNRKLKSLFLQSKLIYDRKYKYTP